MQVNVGHIYLQESFLMCFKIEATASTKKYCCDILIKKSSVLHLHYPRSFVIKNGSKLKQTVTFFWRHDFGFPFFFIAVATTF